MIGYIKLKTTNQELYETNYLEKLKEKNTRLSHLQYLICYFYLEFVVWIKYIGNMITIKKIYHAYLFIFPFELKEGKYTEYKLKCCSKKMQKLMKKYQIDTIVLAEELEKKLENLIENEKVQQLQEKTENLKTEHLQLKTENLKNRQESITGKSRYSKLNQKKNEEQSLSFQVNRKVQILDGKGLMPYLVKEILEYIMERQNTKTQLEDIYLCIKETKPIYIENISYLAQYFKTINIITPNITKFQKIADRIEENQNSIITVINNKKKSLKKAQWIVNFDFTKEELKKYTIFRRAVILEIKKGEEYDHICFEGASIQKAKIDTSPEIKEFFAQYYLLQNCSLEALYESLMDERQGFAKIKEQMRQDQIRVVKLCGRNLANK